MNRIATLLCLMLFSQVAVCASLSNDQQQRRYVFCNVYAASACFGVASGDVMEMRVPADFVTYDLVLSGGVKVLIYSGYNPGEVSDMGPSRMSKHEVASGIYDARMAPDGRRVITYTPRDTALPLLQIVAEPIGASQWPLLADFLSAFRPCRSDAPGATCNKDQILFKDIVEEVFTSPGE